MFRYNQVRLITKILQNFLGVKEGYAGVALYSKLKPLSVKIGIGHKEHDTEGRVITAEYEDFYLVTAYVPNAGV